MLQVTLRVAIFAAIVLLFAVVASAEEGGSSKIRRLGGDARRRPIRSTLHACRQDFRRLCIKRRNQEGAVEPVTRLSPNECLQKNVESIESDVCKTWVNAEKKCTEAAKGTKTCTKNMDIRRCFAKLPSADLPDDCTSTDFYKAITSVRKRGFMQNRTKSA